MNNTHTRWGERTRAPCRVAGAGWQTKAAQCSSFLSVIQGIIFKKTLTECLLFHKTMAWAPVGCGTGSAGTLMRSVPPAALQWQADIPQAGLAMGTAKSVFKCTPLCFISLGSKGLMT